MLEIAQSILTGLRWRAFEKITHSHSNELRIKAQNVKLFLLICRAFAIITILFCGKLNSNKNLFVKCVVLVLWNEHDVYTRGGRIRWRGPLAMLWLGGSLARRLPRHEQNAELAQLLYERVGHTFALRSSVCFLTCISPLRNPDYAWPPRLLLADREYTTLHIPLILHMWK
jgi:hypothetical protein